MKDDQRGAYLSIKAWVKRLGAVGFTFFLVKGLLWLLVPAVLAYFFAW